MTISDPLGRENYVRLVCQGYLALKLPIPAEFWDEWEAIQAADEAAEEARAKDFWDGVPDVGPLEVWAVADEGEFLLEPKGPASEGSIVMEAHSVPFSGLVTHIELRKQRWLGLGKGALVASIPIQINQMVVGDSITVMLNGMDIAAVLKGLRDN